MSKENVTDPTESSQYAYSNRAKLLNQA